MSTQHSVPGRDKCPTNERKNNCARAPFIWSYGCRLKKKKLVSDLENCGQGDKCMPPNVVENIPPDFFGEAKPIH